MQLPVDRTFEDAIESSTKAKIIPEAIEWNRHPEEQANITKQDTCRNSVQGKLLLTGYWLPLILFFQSYIY